MIEQPDIEPIGRGRYRLRRDYSFEWVAPHGQGTATHRITVRAGFIFDGNSVPRLLWTLLGMIPDGLNRSAGLIHDYIYKHRGNLPISDYQILFNGQWYSKGEKITRKTADDLYKYINELSEYPQAELAYKGVRLGGWWPWSFKYRWLEFRERAKKFLGIAK